MVTSPAAPTLRQPLPLRTVRLPPPRSGLPAAFSCTLRLTEGGGGARSGGGGRRPSSGRLAAMRTQGPGLPLPLPQRWGSGGEAPSLSSG